MKLQLYCSTCMVKQAISAMNLHGIDYKNQIEILEKMVSEMPNFLNQPTPSHFQSIMLNKLAEYLQINDIYAEEKRKQNSIAAELIPFAREAIYKSKNSLYTAALLAVEGNSIDQLFFANIDLRSQIKGISSHSFKIDDFNSFIILLSRAKKIVYVLDNAGEIFFDKLFIETIQGWRSSHGMNPNDITCIIKGGPVLNDATEEDAALVKLEEVSQVISSGSNYLGLPLDQINDESKEVLASADLIISKGQANFETLDEVNSLVGKTFFLLKAKCLHLSSRFNVQTGSSILYFPV